MLRGEGQEVDERYRLPNRDERSRIGEMARFREISGSSSPDDFLSETLLPMLGLKMGKKKSE